jgi:hypothetical protein
MERTEKKPRAMLEVGVEGDLFRVHDETPQCRAAGCVVATDAAIDRAVSALKARGKSGPRDFPP